MTNRQNVKAILECVFAGSKDELIEVACERICELKEFEINKIRAEIYQLHCHPKLDFIKTDEVVDMALDIIDKYR